MQHFTSGIHPSTRRELCGSESRAFCVYLLLIAIRKLKPATSVHKVSSASSCICRNTLPFILTQHLAVSLCKSLVKNWINVTLHYNKATAAQYRSSTLRNWLIQQTSKVNFSLSLTQNYKPVTWQGITEHDYRLYFYIHCTKWAASYICHYMVPQSSLLVRALLAVQMCAWHKTAPQSQEVLGLNSLQW